jgi:hypothetical protein
MRSREVGWRIEFNATNREGVEKSFEVVEAKRMCNMLMALYPELDFSLTFQGGKDGEDRRIAFKTSERGVEYVP